MFYFYLVGTLSKMESDRILRRRVKPVEYFPKQKLYTVATLEECGRAGFRRRSKSTEHQSCRKNVAGRRTNRSQSVDQPRIAARRVVRSQSIDQPTAAARRARRSKSAGPEDRRDTFSYMAQAHATLAMQLEKAKDELDEKNKKIELLIKQNTANQKLIADMNKECQEKDAEIARLQGNALLM